MCSLTKNHCISSIIITRQVTRAAHVRNRVCPRVELILKIIIILLIIFLVLYNTLFSWEEIFAKSEFEIFSREDIFANILFTRKYLPAKISSRENNFPRKYLLAKISSRENIFLRICSVLQICRLVGLGYAV